MVGRAVSSRTPTDFHPSEVMASPGSPPLTKRRTDPGPHMGCPHCAVGMQSAADSEIGLPNMPTSASRMLVFLTPPEVRSIFIAGAPWPCWTWGNGRPAGDPGCRRVSTPYTQTTPPRCGGGERAGEYGCRMTRFRAVLEPTGGNNVGIVVPEPTVLAFNRGKRVPVIVTIDGVYTYRT